MMPPFLCTTALTEFWNTDAEKILYLGQWCLLYGRQQDWKHLQNSEVLPYPWDDREAMHQAAYYEEDIYEQLLDVLREYLNHAHGETHGKEYWRIILGPWLLHYVQVLHERYLCLKQAYDLYPDLKTIGLAPTSFKIPRNFSDYHHGIVSDPYNLQIYSNLQQSMGINIPVRDFDWDWNQTRSGMPIFSTKRQLLHGLKNTVNTVWRRFARHARLLLVDVQLSKIEIILLMMKTGLKAQWCKMPPSDIWIDEVTHTKPNPARAALADLKIDANDDFAKIIPATLPSNFPMMYLEGYAQCREYVRRNWSNSSIRTLMTGNAIHNFNETFRFVAAELKERGAKLIGIQHGGNYGTAQYNPNERIERQVSDEYWTWGWGQKETGIKSVPSPKLSHFVVHAQQNRPKSPQYLLFIGNIVPRYHYRTWSCPTANQGIAYLDWQIHFLSALDKNIQSKTLMRTYHKDYGWSLKKRIRDANPHIRIDNGKMDYNTRLAEADLVVCDMNQTSFLETLVANIPTIFFWNPQTFELRSQAVPFFAQLEKSGLFYLSPIAAASAVNKMWPEIDKWWNRETVQAARLKFIRRFALHSENISTSFSTVVADYVIQEKRVHCNDC